MSRNFVQTHATEANIRLTRRLELDAVAPVLGPLSSLLALGQVEHKRLTTRVVLLVDHANG